jgi:hypothetical protein
VAELQEDVTRAWAIVVLAETHAARAEKMAQERLILMATAHGEADEATQRVSALEGELAAMRQAQDAAEGKFLSLLALAAVGEWPGAAVEEQCKCLVHELTLLSLRGSELCMTIIGAPPLTHLHEGMRFAIARHTKVSMQLSALLAAVSLATKSIIGHLPANSSQVSVVGEKVAMF